MERFIELIKSRRSIRHFLNKPVEKELIIKVLEAGRWAPSGLNNQPWKFVIITDKAVKEKIGTLSHYKRIFIEAPVLIGIFLDNNNIYHREKDIMGVGACFENILLAIHAIGLGGVWLGEILKAKDEVKNILKLDEHLELMGFIAFGYPDKEKIKETRSSRKELSELIVKEI